MGVHRILLDEIAAQIILHMLILHNIVDRHLVVIRFARLIRQLTLRCSKSRCAILSLLKLDFLWLLFAGYSSLSLLV